MQTSQQPIDRVAEIPQPVAGPRTASRSWTLRADIPFMAVFITRSGRNILPAISQPSTNETIDVRLASTLDQAVQLAERLVNG